MEPNLEKISAIAAISDLHSAAEELIQYMELPDDPDNSANSLCTSVWELLYKCSAEVDDILTKEDLDVVDFWQHLSNLLGDKYPSGLFHHFIYHIQSCELARYYDRKALKKYEETSEVDKTIIGHVFDNLNKVHWLAFEIPMNHYDIRVSLDEAAERLARCSFGMTMVLLDPKLYHDLDSKAIVKKYLDRLHNSRCVRVNFLEALKKWDDFLD